MGGSWEHHVKGNKSNRKDKYCMIPYIYEGPRGLKFIETESTIEIAGGWWWMEGEWGVSFNGYEVSVWEDEKILEMESGDSWATWMCWIHFKVVEMVNFMLQIFYHNNKKFRGNARWMGGPRSYQSSHSLLLICFWHWSFNKWWDQGLDFKWWV